jgi:phage terminase large subunit-like protein
MNAYPIWQLYSKEVAAACAQTYALFETGKIRHNNDPLLIKQTPAGVAKYIGDTWYLSRRDSHGDIDALMATVFAIYVAGTKEESAIGVF